MISWPTLKPIKVLGRHQIPPGPECIAGYACDYLDKSYCSLLHDLICLIEEPGGWKHYKLPKCPGSPAVESPHLTDEERLFIHRYHDEPAERIAGRMP